MYQIQVTQPAKEDLQSAISYIADQLKNQQAAHNLLSAVEKSIRSLSEMPERFPLIEDEILKREGFRFFRVKNYLVFYTVRHSSNTVVIQRFLYGRRDWLHLLKAHGSEILTVDDDI